MNKYVKNLLLMSLVASLISFVSIAAGAEGRSATDKDQSANSAAKNSEEHAFLGLAVESLPQTFARQFPDLKGRGVLVVQVTKDSPADRAGLKQDDILTGYDKQDLYAPEQLVKMIQNDKPGREVTLKWLSSGKEQSVNVALGSHSGISRDAQTSRTGAAEHRGDRIERLLTLGERLSPALRDLETRGSAENDANWERFDSMTLSQLGDKKFKAEIAYRDDQGKMQRKQFQGTRQEIRDALNKETDFPAVERDNLLRALDFKPAIIEFPAPQGTDKPQTPPKPQGNDSRDS